jgi:hypothetical protein
MVGLGLCHGEIIALRVIWDDLLGIGECISSGMRRLTDVLVATVALLRRALKRLQIVPVDEDEYETIPDITGIRRFIWGHLYDVYRVIHCLGHADATVSALKLFLAAPEVIILGHKCMYRRRIPDDSKVAKIHTWPPCKTVTDVRAFLGTAGTMRIWIRNYSAFACPLVDLTCKDADFTWMGQHDAMQELKDTITTSPVLIPIDYTSSRPIYLAIDSSWRAVEWILSQECENGQRFPSRFGAIAWNECEQRYSQPKSSFMTSSAPSARFVFRLSASLSSL